MVAPRTVTEIIWFSNVRASPAPISFVNLRDIKPIFCNISNISDSTVRIRGVKWFLCEVVSLLKWSLTGSLLYSSL